MSLSTINEANDWAPYLDRYRRGESRDRIFFDMILADANRLGSGPTLLDIGCGKGFDTDVSLQRAMARASGWYIGVEPDPEIPLGSFFNETHRCLFEEAPLAPGSVHLAFAVMVLEHLESPQSFWDKAWEVLAEGGVFWGLTVDARHWYRQGSLLFERLGLTSSYLNYLFGARGQDRYENYPVFYRSNTPLRVRKLARQFRRCDFVNFAREAQCTSLFPRPLRPAVQMVNRWRMRRGYPGSLLAIRAVK